VKAITFSAEEKKKKGAGFKEFGYLHAESLFAGWGGGKKLTGKGRRGGLVRAVGCRRISHGRKSGGRKGNAGKKEERDELVSGRGKGKVGTSVLENASGFRGRREVMSRLRRQQERKEKERKKRSETGNQACC